MRHPVFPALLMQQEDMLGLVAANTGACPFDPIRRAPDFGHGDPVLIMHLELPVKR